MLEEPQRNVKMPRGSDKNNTSIKPCLLNFKFRDKVGMKITL